MAQETTPPALRNNASIWSLVTGPEASNWSRLLVCSHLDSSTRLALFFTCKAASNTVLVNADQACVYLCGDDEESSEEEEEEQPREEDTREEQLLNLDRLRSIRAGLQTRGKLRTKLTLRCSTAAMLTFALGVLEAGTTWLDELAIHRPSDDDEQLPTAVLASVGRCCPNLRALSLPQAPGMPSPVHFPKLEELSVYLGDNNSMGRMYGCLAPYVKQLTQLTIRAAYPPPEPLTAHLPLLLTPATRLRTLHIHAALDDTGLGLLLQCAPALEELTVTEVRLQSAAHAQLYTQWQLLHTDVLHLSSLARLPLAADSLRIRLNASGILVCDIIAGEETAHLKGAHLDYRYVIIRPGVDVRVEDQPAALRVGLRLLRARPSSGGPYFLLDGWTMSRDVVQELRQLPQHAMRLTFAKDLVWLAQPAHLYNTLLRLLPDSVAAVVIYKGAGAGVLTDTQIESICLGAPTNRSAQVPLCVTLPNRAALVQAIQQKIEQVT